MWICPSAISNGNGGQRNSMFSCIAMADDDSMETSILVNQAESKRGDVTELKLLGCMRPGRGVHMEGAPLQRIKPMFFAGVSILSLVIGVAILWLSFHHRRAASEPLASMRSLQLPTFECHAEAASWSIAWSLEKKAWCCQHTGRGCHIRGNVESANVQSANIQSTDVEVAAPRDLQGGIGAITAAKSLQKKGPWCYLTHGQACGSSSSVPLTIAATFAVSVMVLAAICGIVGWQRCKGQEKSSNSLPRSEKLTTSSLPPLAGLGKEVKEKPTRSCRMCS